MNRPQRSTTLLRWPLCIGAFALVFGSHAQQDPLYTMYMWNMMTVNPGYAGSADVMNATVLARRQWVGIDGAPATNSLMVHTPLRTKSVGLGLSVLDDRIGPGRTTGAFADFAYRIRTGGACRLAFGLKAGFNSMRMRMSSVPGTDANDPVFQQDISGGFKPNFGFGLYYWGKKGYAGLSTPKLLQEDLMARAESGDVHSFRQQMHYFLTAGYVFPLSKEVKFKPALLAKAVAGAPLAMDLSANFLFMDQFWVGAAYRTANEASAILSYQITDQLRAGYSFDYAFSGIRSRTSGSHEIMATYDLSFTKHLLRSPRYF